MPMQLSALKVEREENNIRSIPFANFYSLLLQNILRNYGFLYL